MSLAPAAWTAEQIARELVPRRDELLARLARVLAKARPLSHDQRELVVDAALDDLVTRHRSPVTDREGLERSFWALAGHHVERALERRGALVRGGYERVDVDALEQLPGARSAEQEALLRIDFELWIEFATTLSRPELELLTCAWTGSRDDPDGERVLTRELRWPRDRVRRVERSLSRKLDRFIVVMTAGRLCAHRSPALDTIAVGQVSDGQLRSAHAHLLHCTSCRAELAERRHALRTGELRRRLAELLPPVTSVPVERARGGGPLHALIDWVTRPFGGEGTHTVAQLAASGAGRGTGAVVAVKLAALCLGGATLAGGGYCAITGTVPIIPKDPVERRPMPRPAPRASPAPDVPAPAIVKPVAAPRTPAKAKPKPKPKSNRDAGRRRASATTAAAADAATPKARAQAREGNYVPPSPAPPESTGEFSFEQSAPPSQPQPAAAPAVGAGEFSP